MTNKERSVAIRSELKKHGYTSRQISVRSGDCGYSDYSHIRIKDVSISRKTIKEICKKYEYISYDEYSGEILQGCNTFIDVDYDYSAVREAKERNIGEARKLVDRALAGDRHVIFKSPAGMSFRLYLCEDNGGTKLCAGRDEQSLTRRELATDVNDKHGAETMAEGVARILAGIE